MSGDVVLVRATSRVSEILYSISHGTGRKMSRSDCKPLADTFDFAALRQRIIIPTGVEDSSLRTDGPFAYRDLDECPALLADRAFPVVTNFRSSCTCGHHAISGPAAFPACQASSISLA
jgi:RNA-splicing ligase RtcB